MKRGMRYGVYAVRAGGSEKWSPGILYTTRDTLPEARDAVEDLRADGEVRPTRVVYQSRSHPFTIHREWKLEDDETELDLCDKCGAERKQT